MRAGQRCYGTTIRRFSLVRTLAGEGPGVPSQLPARVRKFD